MIQIDPQTGALTTPEGVVSRDTTKSSVLASPMFVSGDYTNEKAGWFNAVLRPQLVDGRQFLVSLFFHEEHLHSITLIDGDPRFGTSWDDWSREKEEARRKSHDEWLVGTLGSIKTDWPWGQLYSVYDDKSAGSSITLLYRSYQTCKPPR